MTVEISGKYVGNLKTELTHGLSGTSIYTAAPIDNNGDGSSFSPTDLVAAAFGSCLVTIIAIVAERDKIDCSNMRFSVEKHMNVAPRRILSIPVKIYMPKGLTNEQKVKLERAALSCPVHQSLLPEIQKEVTFVYE